MDNNLTKHSSNTPALQPSLSNADRRLWSAKAIESRWSAIKESGQFEQDKAELAKFSVLENSRLPAARTAKDALNSDIATVATVKKYFGEETAKDALIETIAFAAGLLNIGKNLQPHQIEFLADEILKDWYWLKLSEIKFVMMEGVRGNYGQIYDCLDFRTVIEWLSKYDETRTEIVEQNSQRAHISEKAESEKQVVVPDELKKLIEKMTRIYDRKLQEFEPDDFFEKYVVQEWEQKSEEEKAKCGAFDVFRFFMIQQAKSQSKVK